MSPKCKIQASNRLGKNTYRTKSILYQFTDHGKCCLNQISLAAVSVTNHLCALMLTCMLAWSFTEGGVLHVQDVYSILSGQPGLP